MKTAFVPLLAGLLAAGPSARRAYAQQAYKFEHVPGGLSALSDEHRQIARAQARQDLLRTRAHALQAGERAVPSRATYCPATGATPDGPEMTRPKQPEPRPFLARHAPYRTR